MPLISKAPNNSAITTFDGIPRVKSGIKAPPVAALFAVSALLRRNGPFPNFSGCLETFSQSHRDKGGNRSSSTG